MRNTGGAIVCMWFGISIRDVFTNETDLPRILIRGARIHCLYHLHTAAKFSGRFVLLSARSRTAILVCYTLMPYRRCHEALSSRQRCCGVSTLACIVSNNGPYKPDFKYLCLERLPHRDFFGFILPLSGAARKRRFRSQTLLSATHG